LEHRDLVISGKDGEIMQHKGSIRELEDELNRLREMNASGD